MIFAISKTSPKSTFISSERDRLGRKPHKPAADISDKSMQRTCSYLPPCTANFAIKTQYWSCISLCQHSCPLGQYVLIFYLGTVWNQEMTLWHFHPRSFLCVEDSFFKHCVKIPEQGYWHIYTLICIEIQIYTHAHIYMHTQIYYINIYWKYIKYYVFSYRHGSISLFRLPISLLCVCPFQSLTSLSHDKTAVDWLPVRRK